MRGGQAQADFEVCSAGQVDDPEAEAGKVRGREEVRQGPEQVQGQAKVDVAGAEKPTADGPA